MTLWINSESRQVALSKNKLVGKDSGIYINLTSDILWSCCRYAVTDYLKDLDNDFEEGSGVVTHQEITTGLKHIVIAEHCSAAVPPWLAFFVELKGLQTLTMVSGNSNASENAAVKQMELSWKDKNKPKMFTGTYREVTRIERGGDADWLWEKMKFAAEEEAKKIEEELEKAKKEEQRLECKEVQEDLTLGQDD